MTALFEPGAEVKARQRAVMLEKLKQGPVSTLEARALGIMSPAARVLELKRGGWPIETQRSLSFDEHGRATRCGVYVLMQGGAP